MGKQDHLNFFFQDGTTITISNSKHLSQLSLPCLLQNLFREIDLVVFLSTVEYPPDHDKYAMEISEVSVTVSMKFGMRAYESA